MGWWGDEKEKTKFNIYLIDNFLSSVIIEIFIYSSLKFGEGDKKEKTKLQYLPYR